MSNGRKYFLNARKGAFTEMPQAGREPASFDTITGHLVNVVFKKTGSGDTVRLYVVNETDFFIISMFVLSRQANAFFYMWKNLNIHEEMTLKMEWRKKRGSLDEQRFDFFSISQNGEEIKWHYTDENAFELPAEVGEKRKALIQMIADEFIPTLEKKKNPFRYHAVYKSAGAGLRGRYFDEYNYKGKVVGPASKDELSTRGLETV